MLRSATFLSIEIEKKFVADFADFVADFVAGKTKPLDYQGGFCFLPQNPQNPPQDFATPDIKISRLKL